MSKRKSPAVAAPVVAPATEEVMATAEHQVGADPAPATAKVSRPRLGVGKFVMNLINTQPELTNSQLLDEVKKEFGDEVKTTKACIAWYKTASKKQAYNAALLRQPPSGPNVKKQA